MSSLKLTNGCSRPRGTVFAWTFGDGGRIVRSAVCFMPFMARRRDPSPLFMIFNNDVHRIDGPFQFRDAQFVSCSPAVNAVLSTLASGHAISDEERERRRAAIVGVTRKDNS